MGGSIQYPHFIMRSLTLFHDVAKTMQLEKCTGLGPGVNKSKARI